MEYRQLGRAGVRVSVIGLGTNRFGSDSLPQREVNQVIDAAQDLGINFIDSSDTYTQQQSEETLGHALKGRWDRFVVATKFVLPVGSGPNDRGASRYHMMHAVGASLRRLQSDHIDLYYIHR
jgi:aryl-alcohol dehydrogenase-like predicted oxidoreductase